MQGTVHRAVTQIGDRLQDATSDGADIPGDYTYRLQPKAVLIIGNLGEMEGENGGGYPDKIRSFELYRRPLPEIMTFDEILARAEWHLASAEQQQYD